ncbi:MAG: twin-arginine translocase TatA/TatE family subunit [Polyangiaceae bacterium]|nr:twin-arginine translocase TatA/TatE family subunit [Polyangiaceae bacterium]
MAHRTTVPIVFGVSLTEIAVIAVVTLIVVGPHKLPGMMRTLGEWLGRLRRLTTEMRVHSGIDEILRQEGIAGGLSELRALVRGELSHIERAVASPANHPTSPDPYVDGVESDLTRESPVEGPDAYGALPDDLLDDAAAPPDDRHQTRPPPPNGPSPAP